MNNDSSINNIDTNDDYYAFLNVSKNANAEEIRNAFRLLSRQFHPDKHTNPALKKHAELMFDKLKKAYDVLSDPDKRAVYDALGESGLNQGGWALVEKNFKSSKEIREEYERIIKEKEERLLEQRLAPKGSVTVLIDATNLFQVDEFDDDDDSIYFSPSSIEIRSMTITQTIDQPLTINNHVILNGLINVRNGIGSGNLSLGLRRIFNRKSRFLARIILENSKSKKQYRLKINLATTWGELEFGAGQGPSISMKGFKTLTPNLHANCQTSLHFTSNGVRPGFSLIFTRQFSKHFAGHLAYRAGMDSSMSTTLVFENEYCRINGSLQFGYRNSFISSSYLHKFYNNDLRCKVGLKCGILGTIFDYGCEKRISNYGTIGAAMTVGSTVGVNIRLKFIRNTQSYIFPILLSDELSTTTIFYGTIIPLITYYLIKTYVVDVYQKKLEKEEIDKEKESNLNILKQKRKQAHSYEELMKEFYEKILEREQKINGLIIEKALYGEENLINKYEYYQKIPDLDDDDNPLNLFDFKIALQVLVNDESRLILTQASKSSLPGFYDPYIGGVKKLLIKYKYKGRDYRVILNENDGITLPSERHQTLSINEDHFN